MNLVLGKVSDAMEYCFFSYSRIGYGMKAFDSGPIPNQFNDTRHTPGPVPHPISITLR